MAFGSWSSSGLPSKSKSCSPVSTEAWSASSSITSRGKFDTNLRPVEESVESATCPLIHFRSRSSTDLFFLTTKSHGRSSGDIA